MRRILILFIVAMVVARISEAQNIAPQSQFHLDQYFYNPAAAGENSLLQGTMTYRSQWVNISGAPTTFSGAVHGALYTSKVGGKRKYLKGQVLKKNQHLYTKKFDRYTFKHAVGANFGTDSFGSFSQSKLALTYATHIPLGIFNMSLGVSGEYTTTKIDPEQVILLDQNDQTYNNYLSQGGSNNSFSAVGGILLYADAGYFGYSTNALVNNASIGDNMLLTNEIYHVIQVGGTQFLNKELFIEEHALIKKTTGLPTTYALSVLANYKETYSGGLGYRYNDAVYIMAGYNYGGFLKFTYSYDLTTSELSTYNSGSHEISVLFQLNRHFRNMMK